MTIRLILDTSTILAYIKGSIHVGEVLAELQEGPNARFAVPVLCLAEAGTMTDDSDTLMLLARHGRAAVVPVPADRWADLVNLSKMLGQVGYSAPFLDMIYRDDCYLVTVTPDRYPDTDMIIQISS